MFSPWKDRKPDFLRFNAEIEARKGWAALREHYRRHPPPGTHRFNPNQPRVPAGNSDGGQWTSTGGGFGQPVIIPPNRSLTHDDQVLSDAVADPIMPWGRYAQNVIRPGGTGTRGRAAPRFPGAEPGQLARLEVAEAREEQAIARVREREPVWKPTPGFYNNGIESAIRRSNDRTLEAEHRLIELIENGIGFGPHYCEGIPARGASRNWTTSETEQNNRNFQNYGCHTCGTKYAGTPHGNAVRDHQPSIALKFPGGPQLIVPHCASCSARQGYWLMSNGYRRK
jgi:hypothetical protein